MPFSRVEPLVRKRRADQRDIYVPLSALRVDIADPFARPADRYRVSVRCKVKSKADAPSLHLSPTSLGQLCGIAGVPSTFMDKLPAALGLKVLRCMLEMSSFGDDKHHLLRVQENRLRAVLPQSYVRFDDGDVLRALGRVVHADATVARMSIDDDSFFLRLLTNDNLNLGTQRARDPGRAGFDVLSSETGRHRLQVRQVVFREICSNGMTMLSESQRLLDRRHTGSDRATFERAVAESFREASTHGQQVAARLAGSRATYVKEPRAEVEQIFRRFRLGSPRGKLGRWVMNEVLRSTSLLGVQRFDVVQAFTAVARGLEHRDRMRFEDAMGAYVLEAPIALGPTPQPVERIQPAIPLGPPRRLSAVEIDGDIPF